VVKAVVLKLVDTLSMWLVHTLLDYAPERVSRVLAAARP